METRLKNGARNIVAGILNRLVLIILPFVSRTVIIYALGSEYLGLSSLFTSVLMVLNLSELGVGSALVYSMYKPIAEGNKEKIRALLSVYKKLFRIIGVVILVLGLLFLPFIRDIIKGNVPKDINVYYLYVIYLFNTAISYFFFAHKRALLTAYQRSDILSNINSAITIILYSSQILLLICTKNYYLYVFAYPIFTIIESLWINYCAGRKYSDLFCSGSITIEDKTEIKQHVKGIALQQFCSTSRNSFDSIVISMFMGLTTIAMYSNYYYIMSSIHAFLYQVPNSIRASVGNSVASESLDKNFGDFNAMYIIYMWISGWCTVCLLCLYQPFMEIWMGKKMMFHFGTVVLFCLYFTLLNLSDIISLYKDAAGLWWHGRYRVIIEAVANLILNFILGYFWGINGVLIATIITITFIGHGYGGYIVFHYYFKGKRFFKFILEQLTYISIIAFASFVTFYVCDFIDAKKWLVLLYRGVVCIILPNIIFYIAYSKYSNFPQAKILFSDILNSIINKH